MIDYLIWYFVIGIIFAFNVKISGGNIETEFYMREYLRLTTNQMILLEIVFWLPIGMFFIYQLGRDK